MNKFLKTMVISMLLIIALPMAKLSAQVSVWDGTWEPWTHGTGTEADPFLIENAQQLAYLAYRVNNGLDAGGGHVSNHDLHYKLMVDVNLNGSENFQWTPIGYWNSITDYQCFGGHFDGNAHEISGVYINSSTDRVGFFGNVDGVTIRNFNVRGGSIATTGYYAGGMIGVAVGEVTITNCYNMGNVSSLVVCGGIVGSTKGATIITNCYNTGNVSSNYYFQGNSGGIVGDAYSGNCTITNCYNTGDLSSASSSVPGSIAGTYGATINNSYYLSSCGGNNSNGGQPMSADAMQSEEFVNTLNNNSNIWTRDIYNVNQGYPIFSGVQYVNVTTTDATDITQTHATLNGTVYTTGIITSCGFKYKKATDSNYQTILASGNGVVSSTLSGLEINAEFQYQTFCTLINGGTYCGETKTFELTWLNQDTICIYDADMLRWVSNQCNSGITFEGKYIKLMNDIILPENMPNNMTSIGIYPDYPFKGTFDGNEKLISNLYIDQPNTPYQGFFGYTQNANLYNVGLVNITASGRNYTGGMVAYAENTSLRDCYVNGGTLFALSYCGGLVGYQDQGTNSIISGCYNTCEVTGNNYVGGLVGFSNYSTVRNSYVASMVAAQGEAVGAIIGGANEVLMYNCYFNVELTGQTNAIGWNNTGKDGGESMTSVQMRDPQFVATLNQGLSTPVWKADYAVPINKGFPILKWQGLGTIVNENNSVGCAISPNPTNGKVTIEAENLKHISISNMLGQTVYDGDAIGNAFEYDFSKYKMGIYLIHIETASGVATKRVVVTR